MKTMYLQSVKTFQTFQHFHVKTKMYSGIFSTHKEAFDPFRMARKLKSPNMELIKNFLLHALSAFILKN